MTDTRLTVERLHPAAQLPRRAHPSDACFDLFACQSQVVAAGQRMALGLGIALQLEPGWEAQIRGRSGLASRGLEVHFGTIDPMYRQEIKVLVSNRSEQDWHLEAGDRVAQLAVVKIWSVEVLEGPVETSARGGLGSTGR